MTRSDIRPSVAGDMESFDDVDTFRQRMHAEHPAPGFDVFDLGLFAPPDGMAAAGNMDLEQIVRYKLRDDMAPFGFQVLSVWHHSLNAIAGLKAGEFSPPPRMSGLDYQALKGLVKEAIEGLQGETPEEINALADKPLLFKMGEMEIPYTTDNFMLSFSLPNFYFHATTTYAVLRAHGVPLGKMDYLGQLRVNL